MPEKKEKRREDIIRELRGGRKKERNKNETLDKRQEKQKRE